MAQVPTYYAEGDGNGSGDIDAPSLVFQDYRSAKSNTGPLGSVVKTRVVPVGADAPGGTLAVLSVKVPCITTTYSW
jgi:hypothetical protein